MLEKAPGSDDQRRRAAQAALDEVGPGMRLGLGSGRTAEHFVRFLGDKVRDGLQVVGVPTSEQTAQLARSVGVPLTTLDETPELDLAVDGADEIDPHLRLIKGGGGALLREKIVAAAARRMIVIADAAKMVPALGGFPLPVEVISFGAVPARLAIERIAAKLGLGGTVKLRMAGAQPFVTDSGNHILDFSFGSIGDPDRLAREMDGVPGVVEHGLFVGLASTALLGTDDGVRRVTIQ
jgi:ribose 5-phosphate isomerase A